MILNVYNFSELEREARELICTCAPNVYGPYPTTIWVKNYIPHCSKCNLPRIQYAYLCDTCEEYFIKDFRHPGFCYRNPHCWDCLKPDAYCHHCMDGWDSNILAYHSEIRPPKLRKKKVEIDPDFNPFENLVFG